MIGSFLLLYHWFSETWWSLEENQETVPAGDRWILISFPWDWRQNRATNPSRRKSISFQSRSGITTRLQQNLGHFSFVSLEFKVCVWAPCDSWELDRFSFYHFKKKSHFASEKIIWLFWSRDHDFVSFFFFCRHVYVLRDNNKLIFGRSSSVVWVMWLGSEMIITLNLDNWITVWKEIKR